MRYDNVKFMESDEKSMMTIDLALEWTLKENNLGLKVFSHGKTLRVINLTESVTRKFVAWLLNTYKWPDDTITEGIKKGIIEQRDEMNKILAELENPSGD